MKEKIQILLNRRRRIQEKINELTEEFNALGDVLQELFEYKEKEEEENSSEEDKEYEM
jgi:hypothetical protein